MQSPDTGHGIGKTRHLFAVLLAGLFILPPLPPFAKAASCTPPLSERAEQVLARISPLLAGELAEKNLRLGAPVYLRIFKLPGELEVWVENEGRYRLFKSYDICSLSGFPGPKTREGDWQSPEGFYEVTAQQMNPQSSYHLSFDIGYPNEYDRAFNRSGGNIMVHGSCSSMGCFAMTNYRIEEIYTLVHSALATGQEAVAVHIFPFALTDANMEKFSDSPWLAFWRNLKEGYDLFEETRRVPAVEVAAGRYLLSAGTRAAASPPAPSSYSLALSPAKSSR